MQTISEIVVAIKQAGYTPYEQLTGYLQTGHDYYITRAMGARDLIKTLDREQLQEYVDSRQDLSRFFSAKVTVSCKK